MKCARRVVARQFRSLCRDRRGVAALTFAVMATAFIGIAGLAIEGSTWYFEHRQGQNAADGAALAAAHQAVADQATGGTPTATDIVAAGTANATSNGYTAGTNAGVTTTVSVQVGNYSNGSFTPSSTWSTLSGSTASTNAVRATVTRKPVQLFSKLYLAAAPTIGETATVAIQAGNGQGCVLALAGGLSFGGSAQVTGQNCVFASNATGANAINFTGSNASVTGGLTAFGGCNSNGSSNQCLTSGTNAFYAPPTIDPYASLQSVTFPTASSTTCQNMPASGNVSTPFETSGKMFCTGTYGGTKYTGDITGSLNFSPGTYILYNAGIKLNGGAVVQCSSCTPGGAGVTIILTGSSASKMGSIRINGNNTITLNAPYTNSYNALFDGVLFYMDAAYSGSVTMNGNAGSSFTGAMYFPNATVSSSGNLTSTANCLVLIGYSVTFTGNTTQSISGCSSVGTKVPTTQAIVPVL